MTQKLALLPDFTLAQPAQGRYNEAHRPLAKELEEEDWAKLLVNLVEQEINSSKIVFLVRCPRLMQLFSRDRTTSSVFQGTCG